MATKKVVIKKVIAVLKEPTINTEYVKYADNVHDSMHAKTRYSGSASKLTTLETDTGELHDAETALTNVPPTGTVGDRDDKKVLVHNDLLSLKIDVQALADADVENAVTIITEAGMQVKGSTARGKRKSKAVDGPDEGTAILYGVGKGAHDWRMSLDGGVTWILLESSSSGVTIVAGLTPGLKTLFQTKRVLTKGRKDPWGDPFSLRPR